MTDVVQIYHNPRCSKSRATLSLLNQRGIAVEKIEYLKTPPTAETVHQLAELLGTGVSDIIRKTDAAYKALDNPPADSDDAALARLIADNPALLQRPIVVNGGKAAIGRPPESVLELF